MLSIRGGVAEWSNALVLKTSEVQASASSNLAPTATFNHNQGKRLRAKRAWLREFRLGAYEERTLGSWCHGVTRNAMESPVDPLPKNWSIGS